MHPGATEVADKDRSHLHELFVKALLRVLIALLSPIGVAKFKNGLLAEIVLESFQRFRKALNISPDRQPKRITGLEGMYSLKRLGA
jgi:hypothetical protein